MNKYKKCMETRIVEGEFKPDFIIPINYVYQNKAAECYEKVQKSKKFWLTRDSKLCIREHKEFFAKLLANHKIIEFGGWDGSALNPVFDYGAKVGINFEYVNIDTGILVPSLMGGNFANRKNVSHKIIVRDFNNPSQFYRGFDEISKTYHEPGTASNQHRAFLFLGSTFCNYYPEEGDVWLQNLKKSLSEDDLFILGFDKRVSAEEHIACYNIPRYKDMCLAVGEHYAMPTDKLEGCVVFDKLGIHAGLLAKESFEWKGKNEPSTIARFDHLARPVGPCLIEKGNFIEIVFSLKTSLEDIVKRMTDNGFDAGDFFENHSLSSSKQHMYNIVMKKAPEINPGPRILHVDK